MLWSYSLVQSTVKLLNFETILLKYNSEIDLIIYVSIDQCNNTFQLCAIYPILHFQFIREMVVINFLPWRTEILWK